MNQMENRFTLTRFAPWVEDFVFRTPGEADRIVILHPADVLWESPVVARSRKSLEEHIAFIRERGITKALVIAENIDFLGQCPTLEDVQVIPAFSAEKFDCSPLYELPNLKQLEVQTVNGPGGEKVACVDYSRIPKLEEAVVTGKKGHRNLDKAEGLRRLWLSQTGLRSLEALKGLKKLEKLSLCYERSLEDISALAELSLRELEIEGCGKIRDFSVLKRLTRLEGLELRGNNELESLEFLRNMPNLREFYVGMNVLDGDLSVCMEIPHVECKNRKHYNRRNADLPKK